MSAAAEAIERAESLLTQRDVLAARAAFWQAERLGWNADHCSGGRWLAGMLAGDFESAWLEGDAIRARGVPDEHRFWQGEDLSRQRVMVRSLHGYGDAVQMLRFAPEIAARAANAVYEVPPRFVEIAHCFPGVQNVITWGENAPAVPPAFDVQIEVMELPYMLRLPAEQLPFTSNYLHLPPAQVDRIRRAMGAADRLRIGLAWTCGEWNITRCLPAGLLEPLLQNSRFEFWSLKGSDASSPGSQPGMLDANRICGDGLLALAATIANLDLVISVDTLAAHMAGALGKPVWLLLQHAADWRWMVDRNDSPWYPTMRIFRQPQPGDWTSVVDNLGSALESL